MDLETALRVFSLGCVGIALPLNIAISIISMSELRYYYWNSAPPVTAFPFAAIPLALSFAICVGVLIHRRRHGKTPSTKVAPWDGLAFLFWLAILISIWSSGIGPLGKVGFGLLAGYATAPMIVVMLIHLFFFKKNIRAFYSSLNIGAWKVHECPNCHSNFIVGAPKQPETTTQAGTNYSLLRGEEYLDADQDAVPYTDGRDSEEQIRPETEDKTEAKTDSKGKATIEV